MAGNSVAGLLTRAALMRGMMTSGPDSYVAGVMDRDFQRTAPDAPLSEALPNLTGPDRCVLVLDADDSLVGMLTSENVSEFILLRQAATHAAIH
jgi:CBS domain-containing protein